MTDPDARYFHGVRADNDHWSDAWNFSLQGTRGSIGLINASESDATPYDVDLAVLAGPPEEWPPMFLSGFMVTLRLGAIVRAGGRIGRGVAPYPTKPWTPDAHARVLRAADRELVLEAGRRKQAPSAPSRICCLWLAQDTLRGRAWVQRMMGSQSFVMQVKVTIELVSCRCDARWLDLVHADPADVDSVSGYWGGQACGDDPLWEYLLEGQIAARDEDELQRLRDFIRIQGPPADMLGPPPPREGADG